MRKLILKMAMSLDGFVGTSSGGIDWIFKSQDEGATAWTVENLWLAGAHLIEAVRSSPAVSPHAATWAEATVVTGDLADEIARLKQQPGRDLLAHGGAGFARSLVQLGLVDEYRLLVHPVVLGRGQPLFTTVSKPTA
jgi:dihydrofolate reductase